MRHLMCPEDFSVEELDELMDVAADIEKNPEKYSEACKGRIMSTCFYEPSTRTRLSHEAAMLKLGGQVLGFSSASSSSVSKGESVADTIRIVSSYSDICVMRHPLAGAPQVAADNSLIPVINAGDGSHQHPTQTLTDLLTIRSLKGHLDNLKIGFCGDLKYGRTVHSLIHAMIRYPGVSFVLISPDSLALPAYVKEVLDKGGFKYQETASLEEAITDLDILYMTRIQKERFPDLESYEAVKDSYVLDPSRMELARSDMFVLHPLPRVNEISVAVDKDERAAYFKQAAYGVYIRMALILKLLKDKDLEVKREHYKQIVNVHKCPNPRCITTTEQELDQIFICKDEESGIYRCRYCETELA